MSETPTNTDRTPLALWRACIWLAIYLVGFAVFAWIASRHCTGRSLMAVLTFIECALMAVVVAVFIVDRDPRELGLIRVLKASLVVCGAAAVLSSLVLALAWAAWGAEPIAGALVSQIVILSFAALLVSVFCLVRCSGSELLFAQLVIIFVACALLGTVFYADPLIEADWNAQRRGTVITIVLAASPVTAISWSLLEFDLMRRQTMYDHVSVIGRWYQTTYPEWWQTVTGYLVISLVMLTGATLLHRQRRMELTREGGKSQ
jgi:hypothetical protein